VVLRCTNVGGGADPDLTRLIPGVLEVAAGRRAHLDVNGDGSARRDHVHVADVADACRRALEQAAPGQARTWNVGSGTSVSVREVVAATEEVTGRSVPVLHRPAVPEPPVIESDIRRIAAELGWAPARSDLRTLIADAWRVARIPGVQ
jgi:UDP-glucose 4-epimerase